MMYIKADDDHCYTAAQLVSFQVVATGGTPWDVRATNTLGVTVTLFEYATQQEARDALAQLIEDLATPAQVSGVVGPSGSPV